MRNILFAALFFLSEINCGPCNSKEVTTVQKFNPTASTPKAMNESEQKKEFEIIEIASKIQETINQQDVYQKVKRKEVITKQIRDNIIHNLSKIHAVRIKLSDNAIKYIVNKHINQYKKKTDIDIRQNIITLMAQYENNIQ